MGRRKIDSKYIDVNLTRTIIISAFLAIYCIYLSIDNFVKGTNMVGFLALFCSVMTAITMVLLSVCKFGKKRRKILMHSAIIIMCFVYWFTFGVFLYTGGTGGTSIFLIFLAAPVGFLFFNLFYGCFFTSVLFIGMTIYLFSPLHLMGYQFPELYYKRLPIMYLVEVIVCAIAQYETDKAKIKQDMAVEEARRASEVKTDFLANTSHEIRTPINAVLGMNEMILREVSTAENISDDKPEEIKKSLEKIGTYAGNVDSAGNNLLAIINDILDFTKIEEGKMDIVEIEYQLSSILNDVSNMIHFKAKEKNLAFTMEVDENIPDCLWGDEVRVRQIITNILGNAVKYTDEGSVLFKVYSEKGPKTPDGHKTIKLIMSVTDTGIGIKEDDLNKLYDKFERINLEKNSTIEGTGLGLAISHRLLDMMNGIIEVESVYGRGSTFTVTIPQRVVADEAIGDYKSRFARQLEERKDYRESFKAPAAKVLIVDDTKMNLLVVCEFLKQTQLQIDTACNGVEAVGKAKENKYDVILMDQRMPEMDGTEAMQRIKADADGPNKDTPVICLTADAVVGAKERYISCGFTDYLTKPIDSEALEKMLRKYLPLSKVILIKKDKKTEDKTPSEINSDDSKSTSDSKYGKLTEIGIDTDKGISNCGGDEGFYNSILMEYLDSSAEKKDKLKLYLETKDLKNYGILVHALKSTSATIGATHLSSLALALEKAAKEDNYEFISSKHAEAMAEYDKLLEKIEQVVEGEENSEYEVVEENGIMEFAPKGEQGESE
ncbi:MAG: response regulator [Lachnospiraceae bacterium]|nr:response regulator [Lachnospiraceae bacterium]